MALEQPKKPVGGAYGAFLTERRPEFAKACAGQKASAISTMAGEAWKNLSEAEKKPFQEKYELAKAKFEKDMAAFLAAGGEKAKGVAALRSEKKKEKSGKKAKKVKDPNQPKRPAGGAYGVFLAENRAEIAESLPEGHKITDVSKAAGEKFKALAEDARQVYHNKYVKKQEQYKAAMAEYKASHPDVAADEEDDEDAEEEGGEETQTPKKATPEKRTVASKVTPKKASPKKRSVVGNNPSPPAKRGRAAKTSAPAGPEIDAALLKQAEGEGLLAQLRNLASRPDVQTSGKSQKQMLECLKNSGGLVNKAKAALLGA